MNPIYLVALACPIAMGLMMLLMGRGMMGKDGAQHDEMSATPDAFGDPEKRLAVLQAQRQLVDAQIAAIAAQAENSGDPISSASGATAR